MKTHCLFALVSSVLAACMTGAPTLGTEVQAEDCPALICGNTPLLGVYPFWELDETGQVRSSNGFQIKSASKNGISYKVDVDGFRLLGRPTNDGPPVDLVGGVIAIDDDLGNAYELNIDAGTDVQYFEGGNDSTWIPTYRISYVQVSDGALGNLPPVLDLCPSDNVRLGARDAILFQGDRYDPISGEPIDIGTTANPWFNLACKDDALWKLALFRHVEAASAPAFVTNVEQRSAALRSIRADYCGIGESNTQLGTAVDWSNAGGWLTPQVGYVPEAVWTGDGAVCVNKPRFIDRENLPCSRPWCSDLPTPLETYGSIITYVPGPS